MITDNSIIMFTNCSIDDQDGFRDRSSTSDKSKVIRNVTWGNQTIHYFENPSKPSITEAIPSVTSKEMADQEMIIDLSEVFGQESEMDFLATRRRRKSICFEEEYDLDSWAQSPVYCTYSISPLNTDESLPSKSDLIFESEDQPMDQFEAPDAVRALQEEAASPLRLTWAQFASDLMETLQMVVSSAMSSATSIGQAIKEGVLSGVVRRATPRTEYSVVITQADSQTKENSIKEVLPVLSFPGETQLLLTSSMRSELTRAAPGLFSPRLSTGHKASITVSTSDLPRLCRSAVSFCSWHLQHIIPDKNRFLRSRRIHLTANSKYWKKFSRNRKKLPFHGKLKLQRQNKTSKVQSCFRQRRTAKMSNTDMEKKR